MIWSCKKRMIFALKQCIPILFRQRRFLKEGCRGDFENIRETDARQSLPLTKRNVIFAVGRSLLLDHRSDGGNGSSGGRGFGLRFDGRRVLEGGLERSQDGRRLLLHLLHWLLLAQRQRHVIVAVVCVSWRGSFIWLRKVVIPSVWTTKHDFLCWFALGDLFYRRVHCGRVLLILNIWQCIACFGIISNEY